MIELGCKRNKRCDFVIRGISFKVPQKNQNMLCEILSGIDISAYSWCCIKNQTEVWDKVSEKELFDETNYNGNDFLKCIQTPHYMIFLKLQAYYQTHNFYEIQSYENFIDSDCQIIVLVYDCEFVEIYAKDITVCNSIYKKASQSGYDDVSYITEDNDRRTKMSII